MPLNMYSLLGPVILGFIALEFIYCLVKKNGFYSFQDSMIGMGTMILAQCFNVAIAGAIVATYGAIHGRFALFELPINFWTLAGCYLGVDFLFYWFHRAGHRVNILWAAHATHHSAEELNYAVALRAAASQRLASFLFYWPLAVIGFAPETIIPVVALNLIIQLLPHTRVVPRLPKWIDYWLNTPYHHRIHHAANPIYWDKNYAGTFILWDRLFGTYRDETEPVYYGISVHPRSWDPTWLNLHWAAVLWDDMRQATHFMDKVRLWFMPPGWRPRNLPPYGKSPAKSAATQIKYQTVSLEGSRGYLLLQLVLNMGIMFFVISNRSPLTASEKLMASVCLWAAITLWGAMLESKPWARPLEATRIVATASYMGFLLDTHGIIGHWAMAVLGGALISLTYLMFGVKGATAEAQAANAQAKVAPDYRADWADALASGVELPASAMASITGAPMPGNLHPRRSAPQPTL